MQDLARGDGKEGRMIRFGLLALLTMLAASCASTVSAPVPDFGPVGDGLKVVGFAIVGAAVVISASRLIK